MLNINDFAARYRISLSWARQLVRRGEVRAEKTNGRYLIAPEEAERWMAEDPYRCWARNISYPDLPAVALNTNDVHALYLCSICYNVPYVEAHRKMGWSAHRLRERGFAIERGWRRGTHPYYRLKDIVEIELPDDAWRIGPHPDYQDPK
jgi:hypothetical protein